VGDGVKRANEFIVGVVVLVSVALVVAAALWLSETRISRKEQLHTVRFVSVGGLKVTTPVTYRGVRVGRIEAIRLTSDNWVEADVRIYAGVALPAEPIVVGAPSSLFGEWTATIMPAEQAPDDPNVRQMLSAAAKPGGSAWPGATLPDVGQLTAQASRIAADIAVLSDRVQTAFDSNAVIELRQSIRDFGAITNKLVQFTQSQTSRLNQITGNVATTSEQVAGASHDVRSIMARIDSATNEGQLQDVMNNAQATSADLQQSAADLRDLMAAARANEASLVHVLVAADSLLTAIQSGQGTLGKLAADSALYNETTSTVKELHGLLQDIRANPRRYFSFSVF
jgi:phospholipid/cholesterol/gamma-HCH transport system substrate-binding protein